MNGLVIYLEEMYKECQIPFEVYVDDEKIFKANPDSPNTNLLESRFLLGTKQLKIQIEDKYKDFIKILEFCIKNRYKEDYTTREKVILELLENSYVSKEKIKDTMPSILKDTYLITIILKDKVIEALEILKNIYNDSETDIAMVKHKNSIVLIGTFEDIDEHVSSIKETIDIAIYERCYISYYNIKDYECLNNIYIDSIYQIELAKKYNVSSRIFAQDSLLFERVIDNLNENTKQRIVDKFNEGFSKLDEDIIKTIEVFFNLDLNLSEASKQLYVHRNTLIYRLDKIQKYTAYDIRKFNDAVLFKIAFFIWREKR